MSSTTRPSALVSELDAYLDSAPRPDCDVVTVGPFTLFMSRSPWPYYARPTIGLRAPISGTDLDALASACAEHDVDLGLEWVHEAHPELAEVAAAYGLDVSSHALMTAAAADVAAAPIDDAIVRIVTAGDLALIEGRAVAEVAFTAGGTATGPVGSDERDKIAVELAPDLVAHLRDRAERGLTITAVAELRTEGVVAVGSYQPVGAFAELVGVATLPSARRQGLAGALTKLLARHASDAGVRTMLLTAQDEPVARIYERLNFQRVGTAHAAEPAD